ncbi:MAG: D-glutamate cyclase family protein [Sulfobacillus sp.]
MNAQDLRTGEEVRMAVRAGQWRAPTSGLVPGVVQANVVMLPGEWAERFAEFVRNNPRPAPLLEITDAGDPTPKRFALHSDLRRDIPLYRVFRDGMATKLVVSMRPVPNAIVEDVAALAAQYPWAHGAPVHVGDPETSVILPTI